MKEYDYGGKRRKENWEEGQMENKNKISKKEKQ